MSHKVILHCTEDGQGSTKTEQGEENIYHEIMSHKVELHCREDEQGRNKM